jgi:hypothetical protein
MRRIFDPPKEDLAPFRLAQILAGVVPARAGNVDAPVRLSEKRLPAAEVGAVEESGIHERSWR